MGLMPRQTAVAAVRHAVQRMMIYRSAADNWLAALEAAVDKVRADLEQAPPGRLGPALIACWQQLEKWKALQVRLEEQFARRLR